MGCDPTKEFLSQNKIDYVYYDITESMVNLKKFLKFRDYAPEFEKIKADGRIGLPCIVVGEDRSIYFDYRELDVDFIKDKGYY